MKRNMKKTLLLTLALSLAGASPLMATTVDVYITGSTAFRAPGTRAGRLARRNR